MSKRSRDDNSVGQVIRAGAPVVAMSMIVAGAAMTSSLCSRPPEKTTTVSVNSTPANPELEKHLARMKKELASVREREVSDYFLKQICQAASLKARGVVQENSEVYYDYAPRALAIVELLGQQEPRIRTATLVRLTGRVNLINQKQEGWEQMVADMYSASTAPAKSSTEALAEFRKLSAEQQELLTNELSAALEDIQTRACKLSPGFQK